MTAPTSDDVGAIVAAIEEQSTLLRDTPCRWPEDRCLEPHAGEGPSWRDMNPDRMCSGCRAYWHLTNAADTLRRWRSDLLAAEAELEATPR